MLKPPSISSKPWALIAWDFIRELLESIELIIGICYNTIFVITDRLTKYAYMLLYKIIYMIINIVYIFLREIVVNHRILEEIILDKDKLFILKFWIILIILLGIKYKMSMLFHP
jgi:hypothetical protein